jgi:hypothetical protein
MSLDYSPSSSSLTMSIPMVLNTADYYGSMALISLRADNTQTWIFYQATVQKIM